MSLPAIEALTQFGVAGLMGTLWVWERAYSRRREQQLSETHDRLMQDREQLDTLVELIQRNTRAVEHFEQTQHQLLQLLERMEHEIHKHAA